MSRIPKTLPPRSGRLFAESQSSGPPSGVHIAHVDGASRGNPGPAAYAVVMRDPAGHVVLELAKKLGRETNNVAEYYALLAALDYAASHGLRALRIRSDSELLVRQIQGRYKVKSAHLRPLHERAQKLARQLEYFAIEHVPREMNRDADALANAALDASPVMSPAPSRAPQETRGTGEEKRAAVSRRIRARFLKGVLVPLESLDLPEDSEVLLDIHLFRTD